MKRARAAQDGQASWEARTPCHSGHASQTDEPIQIIAHSSDTPRRGADCSRRQDAAAPRQVLLPGPTFTPRNHWPSKPCPRGAPCLQQVRQVRTPPPALGERLANSGNAWLSNRRTCPLRFITRSPVCCQYGTQLLHPAVRRRRRFACKSQPRWRVTGAGSHHG